jgi:hypothetical protein
MARASQITRRSTMKRITITTVLFPAPDWVAA